MTTWRRYNFEWPGRWPHPRSYPKMRAAMEHFASLHWWYQDAEIDGEPFGAFSLSFTVAARDQWWANRRALTLASRIFAAAHIPRADIPVPTWERLAPHDNRGHYRPVAAPTGRRDAYAGASAAPVPSTTLPDQDTNEPVQPVL